MNSIPVLKNLKCIKPNNKDIWVFYVKLIIQSVHNKTKITQIHDSWENLGKLHSDTQL